MSGEPSPLDGVVNVCGGGTRPPVLLFRVAPGIVGERAAVTAVSEETSFVLHLHDRVFGVYPLEVPHERGERARIGLDEVLAEHAEDRAVDAEATGQHMLRVARRTGRGS